MLRRTNERARLKSLNVIDEVDPPRWVMLAVQIDLPRVLLMLTELALIGLALMLISEF